MLSQPVATLVALVLCYSLLRIALHFTQDPKEPPLVRNGIPFLSPLVGMITEKTHFYVNIRKEYKLGIYTLRLPGVRVYIINATDLIPAVQKQWRLVSFTPILAKSGPSVLGMSKAGADILHKDMKSDSNSVVESIPIMSRALGPGPSLDTMNRTAVEVMVDSMEKMRRNGCSTIEFWAWTHHEILKATTEAVYGPQNPFRQQAVEDAWNVFEPSYLGLALAPFKMITAGKAYRAREFLVSAWRKYIEDGGPKEASSFIHATHAHNVAHGFCLDDLARFEVGHSFAVIGTTAPTTWWLIYHIFSDPSVLKDVRDELSALVKEAKDGSYHVDLSAVRNACPILLSTFKETMRHRAIGNAVRVCLEDTMINDRILFKKNALVIMPQIVHHTEPATWGDDSHKFDHRRFVPVPGRPRPNPVAFRAFGGGHNLCPGRHFSSTEILAFAALMVLFFDITPGTGSWTEPTWARTPMVSSFHIPDEDIEIQVKPRDERVWKVSFSGSNNTIQIVSEDIKEE